LVFRKSIWFKSARGGYEISMFWEEGQVKSLLIKSKQVGDEINLNASNYAKPKNQSLRKKISLKS
jgi:hypothetical protein